MRTTSARAASWRCWDVSRHHRQARVDARRHHRPRREGPGACPAPVVRLPPSWAGWEGGEVSRGRATAHQEHRRTGAASTLRRWPQMDGGGHRQRLSQRVAGGRQHGCWHGNRKKVSIAGTIRPKAVFAQSEECYAAPCRLICPESHKDGAGPYKIVERRVIQRYAVLCGILWCSMDTGSNGMVQDGVIRLVAVQL
jgi:hypothetical protein